MVSSRSDTKRRRRDSSPLDANPKRTKVHAQRKFAQGVSSLSNLLHLTPVKEKSEKSSGSSGNLANGLKASESLGNHSDVVTTGKRALPARGAKKPSIEDMITFLCYRGTTALPSHLVHLNKAPSPEPTLLSQQGSSDNSRNRLGDKNKESEKKTKKPLKSAASSALKAVNAAQALKRKYQEQRIKKTTVSTLTSKVKSTPILRTTRSNAGAVVNISSKTLQKKVGTKKVETRKKDSTHKENLTSKKSSKTSSGKPSVSSPSLIVTPSSGNRGGLRSGKVVTENVVRSSRRNLGTSVTLKTKQKSGVSSPEGGSPLSKKLATSLSDFSSEDDQPLVKKPKPLVQVQKLIKKSIANIGRKMKMEPRRSRRGLSSSPSSPPSAHRFVALLPGQANASTSNNNASDSQEDNSKQRTGSKKLAASSSCKDVNGVLRKSHSNDNDKKDVHSTPSTTPVRMKKGYVMELVCDTTGETESEVLETRSRRGSRDMRDTSLEDKANINHGGQDHVKNLPAEIKKKDQSKVAEQSKNLPTESKRKETKATEQSKKVGNGATPKPANTKVTSSLSKSQLDLPLAAVLKSPPDLRIPSSIKRPLTAVGITNPMAIAAAAAVVCKSSTSTVDDKGKPKESPQSKDSKDKKDTRKRESTSGNSKSLKSNSSKVDDKTDSDQNKAQEETNIKVVDQISSKQDRLKYGGSPKKKSDDTSDENTKVVSSMSIKDTKLMKVRTDLNSSCKKTVKDEDTKLPRTSRRSGFKVPSDEDEAPLTGSIAIKKGSDEDEVKLSPRTRRSNVRLSKKAVCSDEEEPTEEVSKISEGKDAKVSIQSRKKICNTESDQDQKKKHYTRQGKVHSSDDEYHVKRTKRDKKKVSRSYDDASSDNGRSGDDNLSDDVSPSTSKPSTRSAVKSHVLERKSSRSTRSGKILDNSEENYSTARSKFRPKSEVSSSEEDSDSESSISPAVPTTRSRTVRKSHSKREASSDSSDEGTDGKISGRSRRSTALKKVLSRGSRSASSESTSDSSFEDNTLGGDRSHRKPTSNKKLLSKKSIRKASSVQARPKSSENDHGGKRQNDDEEGNDVKLRRRQSRSPRRSSRRSTLVKNNESKNVSSASDASSSDSSPSQNRRVLRQRRGFFSFAEVDPPSDSEEDVIAATKASLEMINQQQSTDSTPAVDSLTKDIPEKDLVFKSIETDSSGSKQTKNFSQEPITCTKKAKLEPSNVKKSLSKKRIKPVSEVQSNLNEELEKTLLSINLSPKMDKSSDKSLQDDTALESSGTAISDSVAYTSEPFLTSMSLTSSVPSAPPSKLHQSGSKTISVDTPLPITSSLVVPCSSSLLTCATTASGSRGAHTTMSQMPSASKSKSSSILASDATLLSSTYGSSLSIKPALPAPMPSMAAPSGMSFNPNSTHSNIGTKVAKAVLTSTSMSAFSNACSSTFSTPPVLMKGQSVSCNLLPIPSGGLSTIATSSTLGIPSTVLSASGQLLTSMQTQVPSALAPAVPASISSSVTTALPTPLTLPISAPIPLSTQLGIPLQTSGNMPLSVPMSTTMTLPLQVGPLSSGTSAAAPFLLPVQSALTSMLAPGQTIIKKESSNLAGITNSVGSAPLMVGMNPLVVNSNRGTIFLSTGSTMTMTSSQQQMVSGPIMPSLLSLRLPDKPQQTIMASSPLYVPFAFGNPGIIQTQAQVQPQIQTMAGVSTITAMATNIQNSMGTNMPNTMSTNLQNVMAASVQNVSPNIQNALVTNIQSVSSASTQHSMVGNIQNSASISSACSPMLTHAQGTGTGMKRQLVLANKNGTMSKLILSVGEDGSHVLAAASPNSVPSSEGQTLMSVMQPVQSSKSGPQVNTTASLQTLPSFSSQSVSISKGSQPLVSVTAGSQPVKQTTISAPKITATFSSQATSGSIVPVTASFISTPVPTSKPLHSTLLSKASNASVSPSKSGLVVTSIVPSSTSSASVESRAVKSGNLPKFAASSSITSNTLPSSSSVMSLASNTSIISSETNKASSTVSTVSCSRTLATPIKADMKQSTTPLIRSSASLVVSSATKPQENRPTSSISTSSSKSSPVVDSLSSKPLVSGKTTIPPDPKVALTGSPVRSVAHGDLITTSSSNTSIVTSPALTSRIPSAPAALAALKSSGTLASTRAIAKTGSSRKPYSSAASYASAKTSDASELVTPSTSPAPASSGQLPSPIMRVTSSQMPPIITSPLKETVSKVSVTPSPSISKSSISAVSTNTDVKRKGTEVELASTHRTLTMLSTAFQGLEKKRDISARKVIETPGSSEKQTGKLNVEKSGLDSLAEVATSLAERSSDGTLCDKRIPEHSLWANPAQILGKETLRVPGLPITANIGTNLPTKNDLAKMKSGAVLADALEKRSLSDIEKLCKVRGNSPGSKCEKSSVSGLLTGSTAETPCQKVQKWLEDGSNLEMEHKHNCRLLSNGSSCTCDVMEEDISNLNSLAEVCVSMERINSPSKEQKNAKQTNKSSTEKKKRNERGDSLKSGAQISPVKSSLPLDSDQMKVTWRNAFGVKSPAKSSKVVNSTQSKRVTLSDELKKIQTTGNMLLEKSCTITADSVPPTALFGQNYGKDLRKQDEGAESSSTDETSQEKKLAQRKSLLGRIPDPSTNLKLDSAAFSADNESSVYAFEAETDTPPVSQPFRRRSKTLSRSDEEDSTSVGSISHPLTVQVSKDPVYVPIQVEIDENIPRSGLLEVPSEKTCNPSNDSQNDDSDVYYIPLGGQEGHEGDVRAVAVRLGKKGPNNRVVMSAKIVKKPPTFKHPNDTAEDGLPNKRVKMEMSSQAGQHSGQQADTKTSAKKSLESKASCQNVGSKAKSPQEKTKRETHFSITDSSGEDTSPLPLLPSSSSSSSKDTKEFKSSMSPASSRNKSPMSDIASPSASQCNSKGKGRLNRQSSIDSDASEKAKSSRRGSKGKSSSSRASPSPSLPSTSSTSSGPSRPSQKSNRSYNGPVPGNISEAPVFHPTEKEFQDPYAYIEKIRPIAEKYGLCRIVAPHSFKPDCNVEDDIRFTADNQYVHKMMDRWGPNAKEMRAIVKYIDQHNIHLKHPPLVGGMELDLPRLYTTVQNFGGLMEVMDKKRWVKVAETMRIPKSAQDRASKLDEVYCKCLLPYETLKTGERDNLFEMVEVEWEMRKERRDKRLAASASSPDEAAADSQADDEDDDEEEDSDADEEDECIVKGRSMPLTTFYRTARNTTHMWFKGSSPSASEVEHEFWRHVRDRNFHICVNAGSVDCSDPPYGFPIRNSPFAKHPWNLKVFSNSNGSVLRSLGSIIGVTVPTLHFGMVFTTCCWYRDPHGLPWIEYLHTGAKKIWYGIPEHGSEKFRSAMQDVAPHYVRKKALWLASDTAMIPPNMLTERKVPLCRTVQEPGQFIVVFPRAHTSSVATGYIVSESVSFAPPSWLLSAMESFREMQKCNEPPLFSLDKLIFAIAEDPRSSLNVLNTILSSVMEILEREITSQQELKKKGVTSTERMERSRKKSAGKKSKIQKELEDVETLECEVCSTILFLSMVVNKEDQSRYCLAHASSFVDQEKLSPSQCKLLYTYTQNELHEFCQNLLDRIEAKSGKKGNNSSGNNSDSGSSASTSTRN